ncbi:hypothetical protein Acr_00g0082810 [Actinidia rufa]|uniref:Uncharacterized protein n=1 Tax=Actinidia rufa TaxID=165716 RepID=A0A7J0DW05_9ERIC|nr:hypothetical protein Acr_00g0082810 [Actinidia rufa]
MTDKVNQLPFFPSEDSLPRDDTSDHEEDPEMAIHTPHENEFNSQEEKYLPPLHSPLERWEELEKLRQAIQPGRLEVEDASDKVVVMAMMEGLRPSPLFDSLSKSVPETQSALQSKADKYIAAKELAEAKSRRRGREDHNRKELESRRANYRNEVNQLPSSPPKDSPPRDDMSDHEEDPEMAIRTPLEKEFHVMTQDDLDRL